MLKKVLAGLGTVVLALGIVTLAAGPASAHTPTVTGSFQCSTPTTGTITWTVQNDTPYGPSTITAASVNPTATLSSNLVGTALGTKNNNSSATTSQSVTGLGSWTLTATLHWTNDGYTASNSGSVQVSANSYSSCTDQTKITICHATASPSNPYVTETVDASSIIGDGHGNSGVNTGDIIPPFTYGSGGTTQSYPGNNWTAGGQLIYNNGCKLPNPPPAPSYTEAVCTATGQVGSASVTIPSGITGIQYYVNGTAAAQGSTVSVAAGSTVHVTETVLAGYALAYPGTLPSYSHTFTNVSTSCVQPAAPTIVQAACTTPGTHSNGSYTIVPTANVVYKVNGVAVTGTTQVTTFPSTVTITAQATNGNILVGTSSWTFTFTDPGSCLQDVSTSVTFTDTVCTGPGTSGGASYTLADTTGVVYSVTVNGQSASGAPGTHSVPAGASVVVNVSAANGYHLTSQASYSWTASAPACLVPATAQVTFMDAICTDVPGVSDPANYTLSTATGVTYTVTVNGSPVSGAPGTYTVPADAEVVVTVSAAPGYQLTAGTQTTYDWTANDVGGCLVGASVSTAPAFTDDQCVDGQPGQATTASYTLYGPADGVDHISYEVSSDDVTFSAQAPGTYDLAQGATVYILAIPDLGYEISGQSSWTFTAADLGTSCDFPATPAAPQFVDAVCNEETPGHTQASYTLVAAPHVTYEVSLDGGTTWNPGTPGVTVDVDPGATVMVLAVPDPGYVLTTPTDLATHTFSDPGACNVQVTPVPPTISDQTCSVGDDGQGVDTNGSLVIPSTTGVEYTLGTSATPIAAGTYPEAPGQYTVTATALPGYVLGDGPSTWTLTSAVAPICGNLPTFPIVTPIVTAPQSSCAATGTYTLSDDLGIPEAVLWTVNGSPVSAGTYTIRAGQTVTIHADANGPDYGFASGQQQDWTISYSVLTTCAQLATLAVTGTTLPVAWIAVGALLLLTGLTLFAVHILRRRRGEL